ncbi:penicillin-binding protein 2 [Chitinasiproducens palmae]|uniref:Peptidoglycan D,D-transpeptidase MrdA n=1 Tax=Chitinasiproducens palmae TaxID=1770053 RepID=A0A1H2PT55_9BURK|nr:penicillin-binding protein 2 [Chitinasiproducens palmae]SDV50283.1 penicillin-binding protein 2 [Chitinasiproducens palmae]
MTEFQDNELTLRRFRMRVAVAVAFVLLCFCLLGTRFAYLQIFRFGKYALQANENRISVAPIVPNRGVITDRNGVVLARNYSAYTLEVTPSQIKRPLEGLIDELAQVIPIDARDRRRFKKLQEESKNFESLPIRTRLTDDEVARFTVQRYRFPGVAVRARLFRQYPLGATAAHVIGYIGRISQRDQDRINEASARNEDAEDYDPRLDATNYKGTDYIGKIGVEQSYETELHGLTGFQQVEVTAGGRPVRTLSRTPSVPGRNLKLSIDIGLQQTAEQAFAGKRGALVAIEPKTGDVLAFVSSPSFDPNLFVDGIDQQSWDELNNSPDHPLLNRPLRGTYPPGSTYKPFMALGALTLKKRTPQWSFRDPGFYMLGGHKFRNDVIAGHGIVDLYRSIVVSNDTYYYMLAHDMGVDAIHDFMKPLGFGQKTGIDINGEGTGVLPSTEWKRRAYRRPEQQKWYEGETVSLGIGQGYNSFTILQLAHATATLANEGVLMKPHLVKEIVDPVTGTSRLTVPTPNGRLAVKDSDIDFVKRAMVGVVREGTGAKVFAGAQYQAAGKTGTAQVFTIGQNEKYRAHLISERMRDHALFIAFAPADNPQIALALIVENGGWGAATAGPVARRVLDYYLVDRQKPGAEAAAVALAASATVGASEPMIGGQPNAAQAVLPASMAAASGVAGVSGASAAAPLSTSGSTAASAALAASAASATAGAQPASAASASAASEATASVPQASVAQALSHAPLAAHARPDGQTGGKTPAPTRRHAAAAAAAERRRAAPAPAAR